MSVSKSDSLEKLNTGENKLATRPLGRLMFEMAVPGIFAQVINILYSLIDRIYIGHIDGVGSDALTGVGLTFPIITLISAFAMIVGSGGAPLASIELGKGNRDKAEKYMGTGVFLLLCFGVVLMAVFGLFRIPLLRSFGASDNTINYAADYLGIYLFGTLSVLLYLGLNPFIIAQGNPIFAMASVGIGAVLNLILDPVFIFGLSLGVRGAAIATVISQSASAIWVINIVRKKEATFSLKLSDVRFDNRIAHNIVALGISPFIMCSTESLISIVINRGLATYGGDVYIGCFTIMQSVLQVIAAPVSGLTQGVQPIISFNYGARNFERVRKTYIRLILCTFSFVHLCTWGTILFARQLAMVFTKEAPLIQVVGQVMPIFMIGMLLFGLQNGIQPTFVALGQAKVSLFIAVFRKIILLIPLAIILPYRFGVMGVFYAEPVSDLLSVSAACTLFYLKMKKIIPRKDT